MNEYDRLELINELAHINATINSLMRIKRITDHYHDENARHLYRQTDNSITVMQQYRHRLYQTLVRDMQNNGATEESALLQR